MANDKIEVKEDEVVRCERCSSDDPAEQREVLWHVTVRAKRRGKDLPYDTVVHYTLCDYCDGLLRYSLGGNLEVKGWDWIDAVDSLHYVPQEVEDEYLRYWEEFSPEISEEKEVIGG